MRKSRIREKPSSEINIVPFTDVLLVLLVIFMVTTPLIVQGQIQVRLPRAQSAAVAPPQKPVTLTLTAAGRLYFNDAEISFQDLPKFLAEAMQKRDDKTVIINADKSASHGRVVNLLDAARAAGATKMAIATENP
jgi:biopolymer transport protein ExbD